MVQSLPLKTLLVGITGFLACLPTVRAQAPISEPILHVDSDHDGLGDALEQQLLEQFKPTFMIAEHDCSVRPAQFRAGVRTPEVFAENGTIYGQVFPARLPGDHAVLAEIHYYHLWRRDCGGHGHALDTEHVAVLVQASDTHLGLATWQARYWYAAAHENTVCDVSQIARASTLGATEHGATVWVSRGKHASFLNGALCHRGCGADRCENLAPLPAGLLINLGEPGSPMNHSAFIASESWPLLAKMSTSNFPSAPIARVDALPETDIAWFHPGRHPAEGIIARSSATEQVIADGGRNTTTAISVAGASTGDALSDTESSTTNALSKSGDATGDALGTSYRKTRHALGRSAHRVGEALRLTPKRPPSPRP